MSSLTDHRARRVCVQQDVFQAISGLALVRLANGTQPEIAHDWVALLHDRVQDLMTALNAGEDIDRDDVVGLVADGQAWLEQMAAEAAA